MDLLAEYNDSSGSDTEVSHAGNGKTGPAGGVAQPIALLRAPRLGGEHASAAGGAGDSSAAAGAPGAAAGGVPASSSHALVVAPAMQGPGTALALRKAAAEASTGGAKLTAIGTFQHEAMDKTSFDMQQHARTHQVVAALSAGTWSGPAAGPRPSAYATAVARAASSVKAGAAEATAAVSGANGAAGPVVKRVKVLHGSSDAGDVNGWCGPWTTYEGERNDRTSALAKGGLTDTQKKIREAQGYHPDRAGKKGEEGDAAAPAWGAQQVGDYVAEGAGVVLSIGEAPSGNAGGSYDERSGDFLPGKAPQLAGVKRPRTEGSSSSDAARGPSAPPASGQGEGAEGGGGPGMPVGEATTKFHGKEEVDYQGRSWLAVPKGIHPDGGAHACHAPKRMVHRFQGHSKGVQSIEFFPGTGHMLLSGSMDSKVKIWDMGMSVAGAGVPRTVRRTYAGHAGSVRQVKFSGDGARFLSASYDKSVKQWDTETGKCLSSLDPRGIPYTAVYYPEDPNVVLVGSSNRKIMQFDVRSGEVVLEYNYHLGAVNSITFFDDNRRIATTSDDKSVLVWDYNTPVPIKYLTDPSAPNIPVMALHPGGHAMAAQCMDNTIAVYHAGERFALDRKKRFTGHVTAGFACGLTFSPDGRFLASGDGDGSFHLWEWGNGAFVKKMKAHDDGPCIGIAWHPLLPTTVATCGWDGAIKLWE